MPTSDNGSTGYQPYQQYTISGVTPAAANGIVYRNVGEKFFELKDHLGNVRVVVSDRKDLNTTDNTLTAHVVSYNNYYPFGMLQPNRNFDSQEYRYGFQGQEKDSELKGEGLSVNYKYRMHDPRLGRFFAVDPLADEYPYNSPYAFSENVVINSVELEGLEKRIIINNNLSGYNKSQIHVVTPQEIKEKYQDAFSTNLLNIAKSLKDFGLLDDNTDLHFKNTGAGSNYDGGKNHILTAKYDVTWLIGGETIRAPIDIPFDAIHVDGSSLIDYPLAILGSGLYSRMFNRITQKSVATTAIKQMFTHFYGTTRGKLIEKLAAQTKYVGWKWLDNIAPNFPTFDFIKGDIYASFKTWKGENFSLSQYKGFVNKIKGKLDEGFKFKGKPYKPKSGVFDILVPENMLKEFKKEGGKYYKQYKELLEYGKRNNVKINLDSKL